MLQLRAELLEAQSHRRAVGDQQPVAVSHVGGGIRRPPVEPLLVIGPSALFSVLAGYREVARLPFHFLPSHCLQPGFDGRPPPPAVVDMFEAATKRLR